MRRPTLFLASALLSAPMWAQIAPLGGYFYGQDAAPSGWEWQSPDSVAYNKQQPHAWFFSFNTVDEARKVLPENSSLWQSLDGQWQFHWASNPSERPKDFYKTDFDASAWDLIPVPMSWNMAGVEPGGKFKYGKPLYSNQRVIFQHSVKVGDWKGGVMREPGRDWQSFTDRNEVGSYRRTFTVPKDWEGKQVYINFDGVDSFFYLYVNGRYVGFAKNSRNLAQFDITPYLNTNGENLLAVEVYRHSDGSFLESQDMYRLPGIFRTVALTAKPKVQVRDIKAIPTYNATTGAASLAISAEVRNLSGKAAKGYTINYSLYADKLYSDENTPVSDVKATAAVGDVAKNAELTATCTLDAAGKVKPWSAEAPNRYVLVGELCDKKGKVVETFSVNVGFRTVEIRQTAAKDDEFGLAGRYYYVNGQPVKLKGVNRHETNLSTGHYVTREQMEKEVFLMKRGNINHVRNSHYPDAPYWYYLCDKYGIYLEDEANIESHEYYYGDASLSHVAEFKNAHVARNMEMVHATVNNPSVVIWSLGNEAGPGKNFVEAYNAIKAYDTSRPVQYERNNDIVDMGSNQYPSPAWVAYAVQGTDKGLKYPFHISEYAHSMGNATGNLQDFWTAIESTNFFMGGAIWDWVDQAMYAYNEKGEKYWAYGGDFSPDNKPNDGMFCMNGVMRPDLEPKGQYFEIKKVYQNIGVKAVDLSKGIVEIFNKNYFEPLKGYDVVWSLWKDGVNVTGNRPFTATKNILGPRERQNYRMDYDFAALDSASEYFVKVQFLQGKDVPWAKKGFVQMEEQLRLKGAEVAAPALASVAANAVPAKSKAKDVKKTLPTGQTISVENDNVSLSINGQTGIIETLTYKGAAGNGTVITDGNGPRLDAFRAPTDNDAGIGFPSNWWSKGLYCLQHKVVGAPTMVEKANGVKQISFTVESQGAEGSRQVYTDRDRSPETVYTFARDRHPLNANDFKFTSDLIYSVYPDGSVEVNSAIGANSPFVVLPRIGYVMKLPTEYKHFQYYGRGPVNNYADRKTGQFIELHHGIVGSQDIMYPKPQSMGNREEVRWCALTNDKGAGVVFVTDSVMSASALPWSQQQLTVAAHPYQLPESDGTYLHLDAKVTGLGGASCGQGGPYKEDQVKSGSYNFGFVIRPISTADEAKTASHVTLSGEKPINISRDLLGNVTLSSKAKDATVLYTVNGVQKATEYTAPISLRDGGTIKAWYKGDNLYVAEKQFDKVEAVPLQVIFTSSEELNGENAPASAIADMNPETYWHTAWSVTMTKYPHWIDFDALETKTIKGFTYLPRQSNLNGCVKDYEIYVSTDGKNWGEPVAKGTFSRDLKQKRVELATPVKARYIRFRAMSSQTGVDYANGAEFNIIAE